MEALIELLRPAVHYGLHLLAPGLIAWFAFRPRWRRAWAIMLATMAVDLDHLLAEPIYDPNRCSVGFHPLHDTWAIAIYGLLLLPPRTRVVATGLSFHMLTDQIDCWMM